MRIRQISVFLENSFGRLYDACDCLGRHKINLRALTLADAADYGVLRVIADQPDKALEALKQERFVASTTEVIAVEVPDVPGGLANVLKPLQSAGVNVEYMYAFVEKTGKGAVVVLRVENVEQATALLEQANVRLLSEQDVALL